AAAAAMLFAAAVSAAPGPDPNPNPLVPATVKPDSVKPDAVPALARPDFCHCWDHSAYPCVPTYRCHAAGFACDGPCSR
ncbi:hypothetical protein GQ42DRAFT_164501, partial [Ramicandelaber brevisporus]